MKYLKRWMNQLDVVLNKRRDVLSHNATFKDKINLN